MHIGVCTLPNQSSIFANAGFNFIELHVQRDLIPLDGDEAFQTAISAIQSSVLPCPVANCFIPGSHKITGSDADFDLLESYVTVAVTRAYLAGIDTIVFGSGGPAIYTIEDKKGKSGRTIEWLCPAPLSEEQT